MSVRGFCSCCKKLFFTWLIFLCSSRLIILNKLYKLATVLEASEVLELIIPSGNIAEIFPLQHSHMHHI